MTEEQKFEFEMSLTSREARLVEFALDLEARRLEDLSRKWEGELEFGCLAEDSNTLRNLAIALRLAMFQHTRRG